MIPSSTCKSWAKLPHLGTAETLFVRTQWPSLGSCPVSSWMCEGIGSYPTMAQCSTRPWAELSHRWRGNTSKVGACADQVRATGQWPFHGATIGIMPSLCGRSPHEGVGKTSSRGQGWNAALSLETILHAAPVRWFPQVVFTHAVQLDTIGNTYRGAATNGITGSLSKRPPWHC